KRSVSSAQSSGYHRNHTQRILYSRCVGRSSLTLGVRHYSQATGGTGDILQGSIATENPFVTDHQTTIDTITTGSDILKDAAHTLNALGEPTLTSLGLGGSTPIGLVQQTVEFTLH
ncbi:hypothetical protein QZH41_019639, partial [Actinostola sp. cb2023]